MRRNPQLHTLALGVVLLVAGCSPRLPVEVIDSIVFTELYDENGSLYCAGSGIVLNHDDDSTHILTAYHTTRVKTTLAGPLPFTNIYLDVPGKVVVVVGKQRYDGTVTWGAADLDAAVIRIDKIDRPAVDLYLGDVEFDEEAVCVGRLPNIKSRPIPQRGRFVGWDDAGARHIYSTHSQRGGSGGGVFVHRDGCWRVVALAVAIGSQADGVLLHHAVWAVPVRTILTAMKVSKDEKIPLPLDLLRGF